MRGYTKSQERSHVGLNKVTRMVTEEVTLTQNLYCTRANEMSLRTEIHQTVWISKIL